MENPVFSEKTKSLLELFQRIIKVSSEYDFEGFNEDFIANIQSLLERHRLFSLLERPVSEEDTEHFMEDLSEAMVMLEQEMGINMDDKNISTPAFENMNEVNYRHTKIRGNKHDGLLSSTELRNHFKFQDIKN